MKEVFTQYEGKGIIDIKGNEDSAIFYHKKQPKVVAWTRDWNTLMNFYTGDASDKQLLFLEEYFELSRMLEQDDLPGKELTQVLQPLMRVLPNATYELEVIESAYQQFLLIVVSAQTISYVDTRELRFNATSHHFYAGSGPLVLYGTQRYLNNNRVLFYEKLIKEGKKPLPIILKIKNGNVNFVLDGHHKIQAYLRQSKMVKAIVISKADNCEIESEKFKQVIRIFSEDKELLKAFEG